MAISAQGLAGSAAVPQPNPSQVGRLAHLHQLRGFALFFIVVDHSADAITFALGLNGSGQTGVPLYKWFDAVTNGTRVPLLLFLAALFIERSLAKGVVPFLVGRARYLAWPLLLWSTVQILVLAPMIGTFGGGEIGSLQRFLGMWWSFSLQFWFLHVLLVFSLLFVLLHRIDKYLVLVGAIAGFVASVALEASQARGWLAIGTIVLGRYFLFFWLGHVLSDWVVRRNAEVPGWMMGVVMVLFCVAIGWPLPNLDMWSGGQVIALSGLPAIPVMLWLGKMLPATPLRPLFDWIGQASLLVFCLHFMMAVLVAFSLHTIGVEDRGILLVGVTAGALVACWLVEKALQGANWSAYAGFRQSA